VLSGSWYCSVCVKENDSAAVEAQVAAEAAAKAARASSKKGKTKGNDANYFCVTVYSYLIV
jgi:hypothetical protein